MKKQLLFLCLLLIFLVGSQVAAAEKVTGQQIKTLIQQLRAGDRNAEAELLKIGAPAVPYLIDNLKYESHENYCDCGYYQFSEISATLYKMGPVAVPELVKAIKNNPKPKVRKFSLKILMEIDDPKAAPLMLSLLKDKNESIANAAFSSLSSMKDPKLLSDLKKLANDSDQSNRRTAIILLARKEPNNLTFLTQLLNDPDPKIRLTAINILAQIRMPEVNRIILDSLQNPDPKVVSAALQNIGYRIFQEENIGYPSLWKNPGREATIAALLPLLKSSDEKIRKEVIEHLTQLKDYQDLLEALNDPSSEVKGAALAGLGRERPVTEKNIARLIEYGLPYVSDDEKFYLWNTSIPDKTLEKRRYIYRLVTYSISDMGNDALPYLINYFNSPDWKIRNLALGSIVRITKNNTEAVEKGLNDPHPTTRVIAVEALTNNESHQMMQLLLLAANNPNLEVRRRAIQLIGYEKFAPGLPVLLEATKDNDKEVRDSAVYGLNEFKQNGVDDPRILPSVLEILNRPDNNLSIKTSILEILSAYKSEAGIPTAISIILNPEVDYNPESSSHIDAFIYLSNFPSKAAPLTLEWLKNPDWRIRATACQLAEHLWDEVEWCQREDVKPTPQEFSAIKEAADLMKKEALPDLRANLKDPNPILRAEALGALASIEGENALPELVYGLIKDGNDDVYGVAYDYIPHMNPAKSAKAIAVMFKDPELKVRETAIWYLWMRQTPQGLAEIEKVMNDPKQPKEIRQKAKKALEIEPRY